MTDTAFLANRSSRDTSDISETSSTLRQIQKPNQHGLLGEQKLKRYLRYMGRRLKSWANSVDQTGPEIWEQDLMLSTAVVSETVQIYGLVLTPPERLGDLINWE
ncbi:hypothetical protein PtA15_13A443 [Puccinia triticina]|uniref:Uncharacterized protein n=1 Tax=Puccinia triticina TaxID=208348 RepID=A0ABY7D0E4_9BASI|nr:uncharacterized protein PtA15_13A443 [Puccinia triticina]WAQ91043.1 hypothetical protein PtA15_13A443 [Puccinia triticina]